MCVITDAVLSCFENKQPVSDVGYIQVEIVKTGAKLRYGAAF